MNQKTKNFTKRFEWDEKITSPHPQPSAWFLPINVRATAAPLTPALRQKSALLNEKRREQSAAFTLVETLITVVILGILAAILVPNLIKNQVENANRTKVKKAMAAYEKAINMMIIENDIKSTENLRELGQDNCQYTREYFKTVQDGSNNCIFKTADRVWWDITDITNPILILKDSQLEKSETELKTLAKNVNDNTVFALVGRFDDLGTLRINDNAYEQGLENNFTNQKYVGKLWYFITQSSSVLTGIQKCQAEGATTCTIVSNGISTTYTKIITNEDTSIDTVYNNTTHEDKEICQYDRENNTKECGYTSIAPKGEYWISENLGRPTEEEAKDMTNSVCTAANCVANGDYYEAAKRKCEAQGAHIATLAELIIAKNNGFYNGETSGGWFWSSNEKDKNHTYTYPNKFGYEYAVKFNEKGQVICVGN